MGPFPASHDPVPFLVSGSGPAGCALHVSGSSPPTAPDEYVYVEHPEISEIAKEEAVQEAVAVRRSYNILVSLRHPQLPVLLVEKNIRSLRPLFFGNRAHPDCISVEQLNAINGAKREDQPAAHIDVRAMQQARKQQV